MSGSLRDLDIISTAMEEDENENEEDAKNEDHSSVGEEKERSEGGK